LPRRRRVNFKTVAHIINELGRQYRRADAGSLEWQDCRAAALVLREMRQAMEGGEIERRIEALEQQLAEARGQPLKPNGHPHAERLV
jgi:hypothetical protein